MDEVVSQKQIFLSQHKNATKMTSKMISGSPLHTRLYTMAPNEKTPAVMYFATIRALQNINQQYVKYPFMFKTLETQIIGYQYVISVMDEN